MAIVYKTSETKDGPMGRYKELVEPFKSNRNAFITQTFHATLTQTVTAGLTHSNNVAVVNHHDQGQVLADTDGLLTFVPNVPLLISTQDCVPIFLWDKKETFVGALHGGWRGIVHEILPQALELLKSRKVKMDSVEIAFGASIRDCHFEVQEDVAALFKPKHAESISKRENKTYIDLIQVLIEQATTHGVLLEHINPKSECSFCTKEKGEYKHFSWRRNKVTTNNSISVIELT